LLLNLIKRYHYKYYLEEETGNAGENCSDYGVAYSTYCIGYSADGYPCQCNVE